MNARRVKPRDLRRRIRADHLEDRFRNATLNSREDLEGEVEDGVDIGGVIEPADEDECLGALQNPGGSPAATGWMFDRIRTSICPAAFRFEDGLLDRADDQGQIGHISPVAAPAPCGSRRRRGDLRVCADPRLTLLTHEAQVHRVEDDPGLRRVSPHGLHVPIGDFGPRDDRQVEFATMLLQVFLDRAVVGRIDHFDAQSLRSSRYGENTRPVVGNESDMMAPALDSPDELHHPK